MKSYVRCKNCSISYGTQLTTQKVERVLEGNLCHSIVGDKNHRKPYQDEYCKSNYIIKIYYKVINEFSDKLQTTKHSPATSETTWKAKVGTGHHAYTVQ
jgi:hypothetical protein